MVLGATLLQDKYERLDGGLPDAARLRSGVYPGLPNTIQPFRKKKRISRIIS